MESAKRKSRFGSDRMIFAQQPWARLIFFAIFLLYLAVATSLPATILMWQGYDDALFIRLGRNIANGQWLGPYNELTLIKAPVYPIFLAIVSWTGLPFNVAQYALYFAGSAYLSAAISRLCNSVSIGVVAFVFILLCPTYYAITNVVREPFYTTLTLFLVGSWINLFFVERTLRSRLIMAVVVGLLSGIYWLTREEGFWLLPSFAIVVTGVFLRGSAAQRKGVLTNIALVALAFASVVSGVGLVNKLVYGHFTIVEMKDRDFQRAMSALQRVGAPLERPFLPVPREARLHLYNAKPILREVAGIPGSGWPPPSHERRKLLCSADDVWRHRRWMVHVGVPRGGWQGRHAHVAESGFELLQEYSG